MSELSLSCLRTHRSATRNTQLLKPIVVLTALGIVYGDIGTSPLYVYQAIAKIKAAVSTQPSALGSLSLIFWTLHHCRFAEICLGGHARR